MKLPGLSSISLNVKTSLTLTDWSHTGRIYRKGDIRTNFYLNLEEHWSCLSYHREVIRIIKSLVLVSKSPLSSSLRGSEVISNRTNPVPYQPLLQSATPALQTLNKRIPTWHNAQILQVELTINTQGPLRAAEIPPLPHGVQLPSTIFRGFSIFLWKSIYSLW